MNRIKFWLKKRRIDKYFKNLSRKQLKADLERCGYKGNFDVGTDQ